MASKKRGGLSKRELAASQKAKSSSKSSSSSRAVASKSVAPLVGAGPLMTGQSRVSSQGPAIGPLLQGQSRPSSSSSKSSSSSRDLASKAQKSKLSPSSSVQAAEASGLLGTQSRVPNADSLSGGTGLKGAVKRGLGAASSLLGDMGQLWAKGASFQAAPGVGNTPDELSQNRRDVMGIPSANASDGDMSRLGMALQKGSTPDIPTGYGDQGEIFFNDNKKMGPKRSDFIEPNTGRMIGGDSEQGVNPFGIPTASASELNYSPNYSPKDNRNYSSKDDTADSSQQRYEDMYGIPEVPYQPTQEEITQQNNELYGGGSMVDTAGGTMGNRSGRGSGAFGTGKGVMSDDPYIKELRKAYSSNGGEKWLRKQFEELISALDPTYAALQKEGTDALNAQLNNDNLKLASVMNANNTGDSEQRAQLMAQQQQGSQTALGNLLAKLSQSKAQDVSGYKSQQAEAMSKLQQNKQQDARTLLEKIQAYRGQQGQGAGRVAGPAVQKTPKLSRNDVFNWVEDALNKGYSWQEIADNAQEQGIGTETGGYLDQLLNNANKQNRYR